MKLALLILCSLSFSTLAKERKPQSVDRLLDFNVAYRGYPVILIESSIVVEGQGQELATELCQKIGAKKGSFLELRLKDFGDRGPDWSAQWNKKEGVFKLVERQKFVTADQLQCEFDNPVTCKPIYSSITIFDLLHSIKCE